MIALIERIIVELLSFFNVFTGIIFSLNIYFFSGPAIFCPLVSSHYH